MPFHQAVQDLILLGHRPALPPPPPRVEPPAALRGLIESVQREHRPLNEAALHAGHRYRSAFWALYLLAALAVLLAVLPVALGWADAAHPLHRFAVVWGVVELAVIGSAWLLYRRGVKGDWQGAWLRTRSRAERFWYLPLAACLRDVQRPAGNWYAQLFGEGADDPAVTRLCEQLDAPARAALNGAWGDDAFVRGFAGWTQGLLAGQRHYHQRVGLRHEALQRRVHRITAALFGLSALAAATHLFWHASGLLIATTAFPALGAALHGALVQGESHRLADTACQLDRQLARLAQELDQVLAAGTSAQRAEGVHRAVYAALNLILEEHQDWHHLVRPHHLPLG
jgi:hypothetical protein